MKSADLSFVTDVFTLPEAYERRHWRGLFVLRRSDGSVPRLRGESDILGVSFGGETSLVWTWRRHADTSRSFLLPSNGCRLNVEVLWGPVKDRAAKRSALLAGYVTEHLELPPLQCESHYFARRFRPTRPVPLPTRFIPLLDGCSLAPPMAGVYELRLKSAFGRVSGHSRILKFGSGFLQQRIRRFADLPQVQSFVDGIEVTWAVSPTVSARASERAHAMDHLPQGGELPPFNKKMP
jgi:hypothetical protein